MKKSFNRYHPHMEPAPPTSGGLDDRLVLAGAAIIFGGKPFW